MTTSQIIDESKTVTRRLGWLNLKPGDMLRPVRKCMGLKPGEKIEALREPVRVVSIRREQLQHMMAGAYGVMECRREGFPYMTPFDFIHFARKTLAFMPGMDSADAAGILGFNHPQATERAFC